MTCPNWFLELWQTFGPAAGWIGLGLWLYQWFNGRNRATHGMKWASSTALVVAALILLEVGIAAFAMVESNQ